jgi:hypothetical protein
MGVGPPLENRLQVIEATLVTLLLEMRGGRCRIVPSQHLERIEHRARLPEVDVRHVLAPARVPRDRGPLEHLRVAVDEAE